VLIRGWELVSERIVSSILHTVIMYVRAVYAAIDLSSMPIMIYHVQLRALFILCRFRTLTPIGDAFIIFLSA
jgi:hypothetical protein